MYTRREVLVNDMFTLQEALPCVIMVQYEMSLNVGGRSAMLNPFTNKNQSKKKKKNVCLVAKPT